MARKYKFRFRHKNTREKQEEIGYGNTKRSAERSARGSLRRRLGISNTQEWYRACVTFDGPY